MWVYLCLKGQFLGVCLCLPDQFCGAHATLPGTSAFFLLHGDALRQAPSFRFAIIRSGLADGSAASALVSQPFFISLHFFCEQAEYFRILPSIRLLLLLSAAAAACSFFWGADVLSSSWEHFKPIAIKRLGCTTKWSEPPPSWERFF